MLKIYLDNCCYCRPFDDLSHEKVNNEAMAKLFIQSLIKFKSLALYYSFMSLAEIDDNPRKEVNTHILDFIGNNATAFVGDKHTDVLKILTNEAMQAGIKIKDATHLACATFAKCDYFITTDKQLLKYKTSQIKIANPVEFVTIWRENI